MIKENFTYQVPELKKVTVQKCATVVDIYGETLACLEKKYLGADQVFTDFRFPKRGELVLCYPKNNIYCQICTLLDSLTSDVPRLIVGPKSKPRRVIFEEVRRDKCVRVGEFYDYSHINSSYPGIYYHAYNNYHFDHEVTIFRKLEDTGDSDPCQK